MHQTDVANYSSFAFKYRTIPRILKQRNKNSRENHRMNLILKLNLTIKDYKMLQKVTRCASYNFTLHQFAYQCEVYAQLIE